MSFPSHPHGHPLLLALVPPHVDPPAGLLVTLLLGSPNRNLPSARYTQWDRCGHGTVLTLSFLCCKLSRPFATYGISPDSSGWLSTSVLRFPHPVWLALLPVYSCQLGLFIAPPDTFGHTCMPLCVVLHFLETPPSPSSSTHFPKHILLPQCVVQPLHLSHNKPLLCLTSYAQTQLILTLPCTLVVRHRYLFYISVCWTKL